MKRLALSPIERQRLAALPAGARVKVNCYQSRPLLYRAVATTGKGPLVVINNKVDTPSQWLASARRDFPQLSYQEAL
jgi:hypothetical protein